MFSQGGLAASHVLAVPGRPWNAGAERLRQGGLGADTAADEAAAVQGPFRALRDPAGQEGRPQSR